MVNDLDRFGERVARDVLDMSDDASTSPPTLRQVCSPLLSSPLLFFPLQWMAGGPVVTMPYAV